MAISIADAVRQLVHNKGISEELIMTIVKEALLAAYRKRFGSTDNAVTIENPDIGDIAIYSKKEVVDEVENELTEISLEEAKKKNAECEIQDEVLVEVHPQELGRIAAQTAKNIVMQKIREIEKDLIYSEFSQKIGQIIQGTYQREKQKAIYVDLGKCEAILPRSEQSPRESYGGGERIKALVLEVNNDPSKGSPVVLSRAHPLFVQRIFEQEVPEIADGSVEIKSVARKAGYRTKISVDSKVVDPVGACVGLKGVRIQNIIRELEGEKIDIVRYSDDIRDYIANSLTPATIERILIVDDEEKRAIAVVAEDQLSLAIGKDGWNVRLGSKLVHWEIDVKSNTDEELENYVDVALKDASLVFGETESHDIDMLELDEALLEILRAAGIHTIEQLIEMDVEEMKSIPGIDLDMVDLLQGTLESMVEVVDEETMDEDEGSEDEDEEEDGTPEKEERTVLTAESLFREESGSEEKEVEEELDDPEQPDGEDGEVYEEVYEEELHCPVCDHVINETMRVCPNCGVELEFEIE